MRAVNGLPNRRGLRHKSHRLRYFGIPAWSACVTPLDNTFSHCQPLQGVVECQQILIRDL